MSGDFMSFINKLHVEPQPGTNKRKLISSLVYASEGVYVVIEKGFVTDYASIPRVLWSLFPADAGDTRRPAVLHDWLYVNHQGLNRTYVDMMFRRALKEEGASLVKRWLMWSAVRTFGWRFWHEN